MKNSYKAPTIELVKYENGDLLSASSETEPTNPEVKDNKNLSGKESEDLGIRDLTDII